MKRNKKAGRVRFEVGGRRYEGTLGDVNRAYASDRRKAGVAWPGGIRPSQKEGGPDQGK